MSMNAVDHCSEITSNVNGPRRLWECLASVLQLGCVLNDGSPDAQKPVQDASRTVQRTTGHFGFELLPTNRRAKSGTERASATSRGRKRTALCAEPKQPAHLRQSGERRRPNTGSPNGRHHQ